MSVVRNYVEELRPCVDEFRGRCPLDLCIWPEGADRMPLGAPWSAPPRRPAPAGAQVTHEAPHGR